MSDTDHTIAYTVVIADTPESLQEQVNALIMKGYRPHGSIAIALNETYELYIQPMTIKE